MNFQFGDSSIVERLSTDQLKGYWHELKMSRYDSHFYLKLFDRIKQMNPNLVMPEEEEMERIRNEALSLAMWEENWESRNRERVKNGGIDYSLFHVDKNMNEMNDDSGLALKAQG
jgi:hypothetical protein